MQKKLCRGNAIYGLPLYFLSMYVLPLLSMWTCAPTLQTLSSPLGTDAAQGNPTV